MIDFGLIGMAWCRQRKGGQGEGVEMTTMTGEVETRPQPDCDW